ncbi:uncharacterized protein CBL_08315 [Carabus blaptoides fortunei]
MPDILSDNVLGKFTNLTKKPEKFLSAPDKLLDSIKDLLKENYDFSKSEEKANTTNALSELITKKFDLEQIWQQVELQNNALLTESLSSVSRLVAAKDRLWFLNLNDSNDENDSDKDEEESDAENELDLESSKVIADSEMEQDTLDDNVHMTDEEEEVTDKKKQSRKSEFKSTKTSIVDDEFFKLDEMEQFLRNEEREKKKPKDDDDESEEDEESVDLFEANAEEEDVEDETDWDMKQQNPRYKDFFGSGDNDNAVKNQETDEEDGTEENLKSTYELREERLKQKIDDIEDVALQEKPWQLKGEITASKRPQNSLLEEIVEFDMTSRPAPVITEETTHCLEDVIIQRIKDKAWDDVERKVRPVDTPMEYRKKLVMDQEKSKQSLAQIYEDEYVKQKEALNPDAEDEKADEEPKEHTEIRSMMRALFTKLDALSNFHFTPKSVAPELRVVNNMPAVSMEEVAPIAASDAALLAPEEVQKKPRGDVIGRTERTDTDKKRERRQKKRKQQVHAAEKEKKEKLRPTLANKYSKESAAKLLNKVTKERNVDKMDESIGAKSVKSSSAFFTQLEEQVKGHIQTKNNKHIKKNKPIFVAKKLKL